MPPPNIAAARRITKESRRADTIAIHRRSASRGSSRRESISARASGAPGASAGGLAIRCSPKPRAQPSFPLLHRRFHCQPWKRHALASTASWLRMNSSRYRLHSPMLHKPFFCHAISEYVCGYEQPEWREDRLPPRLAHHFAGDQEYIARKLPVAAGSAARPTESLPQPVKKLILSWPRQESRYKPFPPKLGCARRSRPAQSSAYAEPAAQPAGCSPSPSTHSVSPWPGNIR